MGLLFPPGVSELSPPWTLSPASSVLLEHPTSCESPGPVTAWGLSFPLPSCPHGSAMMAGSPLCPG